jgi:hypothetical protein
MQEKTGYFAASSELLPLLHTWSLAVEEQYYLLFPLLFLAVQRLMPRRLPVVLAVLIVLSAGLAHWGSTYKPYVNFFFSFSRFWEILVGALVACAPPLISRRWHGAPTLAGLAMIAAAVFGFSASTPTPSLPTFLPVIGAALVLVFGAQPGWVHRFLTLTPMLWLGAISYSLYLWHQPVFAFARIYFVTGVPVPIMTGLVALVIVLSWLSWRFIEQPIRRLPTFSRRGVFAFAAVGVAGFFMLGLWLEKSDLSRYRYTEADLRLLNFAKTYLTKTRQTEAGRYLIRCSNEGKGKGRPNVAVCVQAGPELPVIWGDSHAKALASGFMFQGVRPGLVSAAGCPPILNASPKISGGDCAAVNADMLRELRRLPLRGALILHANWLISFEGRHARFLSSTEFRNAIAVTISELRRVQPEMDILLVGGVPQWGEGLPSYLYRLGFLLDGPHRVIPPDQEVIRSFNTQLREVANEQGIRFLDPFDVFCNDDGCLATVEVNGEVVPTAWDYGHLTGAGAALLATKILQDYSVPQ